MTFSFVIPVYGNYALLHQLLFDIYKNCARPDEVIIVDDCTPVENFRKGIDWWIGTDLLPLEYIRQEKNLGFLKNSNYGLKKAKGDLVCLISTDVRLHKDLVRHIPADDDFLGGRLLNWDTGWNTFNGKIFPYLEGWLLTTWKMNWESCGYFDERYAPNDMEDVDISTTAQELGITLDPYPEGFATHLGAQSIGYNPEREALTIQNKKKFEEKWVRK